MRIIIPALRDHFVNYFKVAIFPSFQKRFRLEMERVKVFEPKLSSIFYSTLDKLEPIRLTANRLRPSYASMLTIVFIIGR